jgi:hypothetical protein
LEGLQIGKSEFLYNGKLFGPDSGYFLESQLVNRFRIHARCGVLENVKADKASPFGSDHSFILTALRRVLCGQKLL